LAQWQLGLPQRRRRVNSAPRNMSGSGRALRGAMTPSSVL
jgi:hypothetical protein